MNFLPFKFVILDHLLFTLVCCCALIRKLFCLKHEKVATFLQSSISQNDESKVLPSDISAGFFMFVDANTLREEASSIARF